MSILAAEPVAPATAAVATANPGQPNGERRPANISLTDLSRTLSTPSGAGEGNNGERKPGKAPTKGGSTNAEPEERGETAPDPAGAEAETDNPEGEPTEGEGQEQTGEQAQGEGTEGGQGQEPGQGEGAPGTEGEQAPGAKALPPELAAAIAEAKAGGEKGKAKLLQRVHTLVDQRDTERNARLQAEERASVMAGELQKLKSGKGETPAPGQPGDPVSSHPAVREVATQLKQVEGYLDWLQDNPEGGELEGQTFDAGQIKTMRKNAERLRVQLTAQQTQREAEVRQEHQRAYQQFHGVATQAYPWVADETHPRNQEMKQFIKGFPGLKQFPDHELVVADYLRGRDARKAAAQQGQTLRKPAPKAPARVAVEAGNAAPARKPGNTKTQASEEEQAAQSRFAKSGKAADLAASFAARRRATAGRA